MAPPGRIRLISSQLLQPTSPSQTSLVPGRMVMRNGLRIPVAMIRPALLVNAGVPLGRLASVLAAMRMTVPSRVTGSPEVRRSWERKAPPSSSPMPAPPMGSPQGLPVWPWST